MACGAGKTLTALWLAEWLSPEHVLVLVPSLALILPHSSTLCVKKRVIYLAVAELLELRQLAVELLQFVVVRLVYAEVQMLDAGREQGMVPFGAGKRHYEWLIKKGYNELHIAVHFEGPDRQENLDGAEALQLEVEAVADQFGAKANVGAWGKKWASAGLVFTLSEMQEPGGASKVARAMAALVEQTLPKLAGSENN